VPVRRAQPGEVGAGGAVAVLHPVAHLGDRAAHHVDVDPRLGADRRAQPQVLVGAEGVVVGLEGAEVLVERGGPQPAVADPVPPVVGVGVAAAGPAQHRRSQRSQRVEHPLPDAVGVRDRRVRADPDAVVDAGAEELDELPVQGGRDAGDRRRGVDVQGHERISFDLTDYLIVIR
jgi:hypothetical protein